jgi:hypothetical protein
MCHTWPFSKGKLHFYPSSLQKLHHFWRDGWLVVQIKVFDKEPSARLVFGSARAYHKTCRYTSISCAFRMCWKKPAYRSHKPIDQDSKVLFPDSWIICATPVPNSIEDGSHASLWIRRKSGIRFPKAKVDARNVSGCYFFIQAGFPVAELTIEVYGPSRLSGPVFQV